MANQIARNFEAIGHDDAVAATADHLVKFWDPRMKAAVFASDCTTLSPVARDAIELLMSGAIPAHQSGATEFNAVAESGHSDAG